MSVIEELILKLNSLTSQDRESNNYPVIVHNENLSAKRKVYAFAEDQFMVESLDNRLPPVIVSHDAISSNYHVWDGLPIPSETIEIGSLLKHEVYNRAFVYTVTCVSGDGILASVVCNEELNVLVDPNETVDPSSEVGKLDIIKLEVVNILNSGWSILTPEVVGG